MAPSFDVSKALESLQTQVKENKNTVLAVAGASTAAIASLYLYRRIKNAVPKAGPYPPSTLPADAYDAVIVGAGAVPWIKLHYTSEGHEGWLVVCGRGWCFDPLAMAPPVSHLILGCRPLRLCLRPLSGQEWRQGGSAGQGDLPPRQGEVFGQQ